MITQSDRAYAEKATEDMIRAYEDGLEIVLGHISFDNPDRADGLWPVLYSPDEHDGGKPFILPFGAKRYGGDELKAVPPASGQLRRPQVSSECWEDAG